MKLRLPKLALSTALGLSLLAGSPGFAKPQAEWIDRETGHRIVRITPEPGGVSLYFTQNAFTPQGDAMVIQNAKGIARVSLDTWEVTQLVERQGIILLFTGRKTRTAYFATRRRADEGGAFTVMAADIDSGEIRKIADVPGGWIGSINADETLLLGQRTLAPERLNPDGTLRDDGAISSVKVRLWLLHPNILRLDDRMTE